MVTEADVRVAGGRILHAYDTRADGIAGRPGARGPAAAVFWLHGSPNIGSPPEPLFAAAEANGLRWVSYDRPGYGGSGPHDGRTVASAAADVAAIADALGIGRFAVLGHSGGGPHALACAALLPERVIAAVSVGRGGAVRRSRIAYRPGRGPHHRARQRPGDADLARRPRPRVTPAGGGGHDEPRLCQLSTAGACRTAPGYWE
jgi:pimeloyl-ACP methyl ester carboxylesterase